MSGFKPAKDADVSYEEAGGPPEDPLAEYVDTVRRREATSGNSSLQAAYSRIEKNGDDLADRTLENYRRTFGEWRDHMDKEDRHLVCPHVQHVVRFLEWQLDEKGNDPETVSGKLSKLGRAYRYWQETVPLARNYDPFAEARRKMGSRLEGSDEKGHHRIPLETMCDIVGDVMHLRSRAIIGMQLKLGLRAGEVANIQLQDLSLSKRELQDHYADLGTHPRLDDRSDAIYVPPSTSNKLKGIPGRDGNKSKRPRLLPIDDELRKLLVRYLLIRPDNGEPYLFLSDTSNSQMDTKPIAGLWADEFPEEYEETEECEAVRSHFGRHFFTSHWTVREGLGANDPRVAYMRGDKITSDVSASMAVYIHTHYEQVEDLYRERIFRLGI